jgi:hypothetical protein
VTKAVKAFGSLSGNSSENPSSAHKVEMFLVCILDICAYFIVALHAGEHTRFCRVGAVVLLNHALQELLKQPRQKRETFGGVSGSEG